MSFKRKILFFIVIGSCLLIACSKTPPAAPVSPVNNTLKPVLPDVAYTYGADVFPTAFNYPPLAFSNSIQHPITNDGATLGRVLFYDKNLSRNNRVACGSCHQQANGFSDPRRFSFGFEGRSGSRNAPAIENTRFSYSFFWDLRAPGVDEQVLMPIQNHMEMGMDLGELVTKLQSVAYYPDLFQKAFGTTDITADKISNALGQFIQSLTTFHSKYDAGVQNGFVDFTTEEMDGMNLFMGGTINCNQCHTTVNFYGTPGGEALNNGLDSVYADNGRGVITGNPADNGKFKVPSLRNIEVSAPYMHDGRFATLDEVVEHYNSGILQHPNLDDRLTTTGTTGGPPKRYLLTTYQKASVVAFLKTLTDHQFLTDVRFSDPFK